MRRSIPRGAFLSRGANFLGVSAAADKKSKANANSISAPSPSPVVNQLDETARETFATGRPLEDTPDLQQCKHCKKGILKTAAKQHIAACLRIKKEKAQRKKEAREARERAKEAAREQEAQKNKKTTNNKTSKKAASGGGAGGSGGDDDSDGDEDEAPEPKKGMDGG